MSRSQPKLHGAMQRILQDRSRPMSTGGIAADNELRDLFRRPKDDKFPDARQIAWRAASKPEKFEVIIRLKQ